MKANAPAGVETRRAGRAKRVKGIFLIVVIRVRPRILTQEGEGDAMKPKVAALLANITGVSMPGMGMGMGGIGGLILLALAVRVVANPHILIGFAIAAFVIVHVCLLAAGGAFRDHAAPMITGFDKVDLPPRKRPVCCATNRRGSGKASLSFSASAVRTRTRIPPFLT